MLDSTVHDDDYDNCDDDAAIMLVVVILVDALVIMILDIHLTKFLIGHLTFYASLASKNRLYKIHASIDKPRLYRDSASYSIQK